MKRGDPVRVRSPLDGAWSATQFRVIDAEASPAGPEFRLQRISDGAVLPRTFTADELLPDQQT